MLRNIAVAAGLIGALAASGALLVAQAKPEPAAKAASANFGPKKAAPDTFAASCTTTESIDTRKEPAWVGQSYANDGCVAPVLPAAIDGLSASRAQILASMAAQKKYAVDADRYQQCIYDAVATRRAQADRQKKTLDVAFVTIENHRVAASEAEKLKLASQVKETIRAYNEAGSEDCK